MPRLFYGRPATIAGRVDNDIASAVSLIMERIETDSPVVMQYRLPCVAILAYLKTEIRSCSLR